MRVDAFDSEIAELTDPIADLFRDHAGYRAIQQLPGVCRKQEVTGSLGLLPDRRWRAGDGQVFKAAEEGVGPAGGLALTFRFWMRPTTVSMAIRPSSRAKGAPKQRWMPEPKATCPEGSRVTSKRSGSG